MLEVRNLASGYQKIPIILGVNFEVADGEFVGILGHNGMGKTTLLKTVVGQLPATAGSIRFGGAEIARAPSYRRARLGLGYVPQGRQIFPGLSVLDNMRMGAASAGLGDDVLDRVTDSLPRLKPILGRAGGVLSGGEQQILALARCLCGQPKLILLDEPTEGIQPSIIEEIIEILLGLKKRSGLTVVLVEQNLEFIRRLSDRVLIIQKGRITGEVPPDHLHDDALVAEFVGNVAAYSLLESLPDNLPSVKYPRTPGYRPEGEENKYNLWSYKSEIKGAPEGKLKGKRVALKDNVCVAGVPMMNGASTLEGYMPDVDATVVTRVLDAGATVVGKVHCEYFCFSGGSHTSSPGPVHNPRKYGYSAGGSSSGSAAIIVTGEADMAIGGDQGGSIRMPASYCGIVGLK